MTARDRILSRLRSVQPHLPSVASSGAVQSPTMPLEESLDRFVIEATALNIECFVEPTAAAVKERVSRLTHTHAVLTWDTPHIPYESASVVENALTGASPLRQQATAEIGLTGCDFAIAETGSLVMFSAPGCSRTVSLLPPVHVAVVRREQLIFSMDEMFSLATTRHRNAASCTIITGPSRTADIELTLTLGIHGPGRVIVIIGP
jgi:L-lactate dehydrogenase complex protein LldG